MEAGRVLNIDSSSINVAIHRPERQRLVKGFLWSYDRHGDLPLKLIYVFDKKGILVDICQDTTEIFNKFFPAKVRKNVLSHVKASIDKSFCSGYYFSYSKEVKPSLFKDPIINFLKFLMY
jgi:hypothetical protein